MKKIIVALVFLLFLTDFAIGQAYNFNSLVGSWRNKAGAGLDVIDSNTVYLVYGEKRKLVTNTKTDFSKKPFMLDLSVKDSSSLLTLKTVLLFVSDNVLQWQVFDSETKPAYYSQRRSDMFILRKVEALKN